LFKLFVGWIQAAYQIRCVWRTQNTAAFKKPESVSFPTDSPIYTEPLPPLLTIRDVSVRYSAELLPHNFCSSADTQQNCYHTISVAVQILSRTATTQFLYQCRYSTELLPHNFCSGADTQQNCYHTISVAVQILSRTATTQFHPPTSFSPPTPHNHFLRLAKLQIPMPITKAYVGSGVTVSLTLYLRHRWRLMVSFTLRPSGHIPSTQ
jgi:hypothetical protein